MAEMLTVRAKGGAKILAELADAEKRYPGALAAAVYMDALESIFGPSQEQVPRDEGRLAGSGRVDPPEVSETNPATVISYNTDYALPVHDRVEVGHRGDTKARYLIDPFLEATPGMTGRIVRRARHNVNRKIGIGNLRTMHGE